LKQHKKKKGNVKALLKSLFYLKPYTWLLTAGIFFLILGLGCKLLVPRIVQFIIDNGFIQKDLSLILLGGGGILVVAVISSFFSYMSNLLNGKFSSGLAFNLRNQLYQHIHYLSFNFHDQTHSGQLLTRLTSDIDMITNFVYSSGYQILISVITFIGSLVLLFLTNWSLTLLITPFILITLLLYALLAKKVTPLVRQGQETIAALNTRLRENFSSITLVKAYNREAHEIGIFDRNNQRNKNINIKISLHFAFFIPLILLLVNLSRILFLWAGASQIVNLNLTVGELIAFNSYLTICLFQMESINTIRVDIIKAGVGAARVVQILETPSAISDKFNACVMPAIHGYVEFKNVSFRYFQSDRNILQAINFKTKPSEKIALLGATGSGKSTIANLIPRFYDATEGSITIDGIDIRDVTLESLRKQIGYVLQEPFLFRKSIRDNIAYGRPESSDEEVIRATQAAEIHEFISSLPEGYDTIIAEKGVSLSGGQKQRITIARTLLIDPAILILDDSTSSVDSVTERKIHEALELVQKGKLSFIIAQRMSTVRKADRIIVLDKGRIVAQGTHQELLAESPLYADIYYLELKNDLQGAAHG
jgi:ATP-binding cassette subfamily B multidrug efflux pump